MKIEQQVLSTFTEHMRSVKFTGKTQLVIIFGSVERLEAPGELQKIAAAFPGVPIVGCSTAGEISRNGVVEHRTGVTVTTLDMASTDIAIERAAIPSMAASAETGAALGKALLKPDLRYVMVLSDGLKVNGAELVRGLCSALPETTVISGGLAGDDARFGRTYVVHGSELLSGQVVAIGFYGRKFNARVMSGSGWVSFGMDRRVTRSEANVVYEIDGQRALDVYSAYLGEEAANLPATGLLYPLAVRIADGDEGLIRTLLAVDREKGSLTFAGDVPQGSNVRLMHANNRQLVAGAGAAAEQAALPAGTVPAQLALLFSCIGRKLLMGSHTDMEIEEVATHLPAETVISGFYTYGEIGYYKDSGHCELHNQTMTVTTLSEEV